MQNKPVVGRGKVKYTKGYGWRIVLSKVFHGLSKLFFIVLAVGTVAIMYYQPVRTDSGWVTAERLSKIARPGDEVLAVDNENAMFLSPLKYAFVKQDIIEGEIVAGPYGEIYNKIDYQIVKYQNEMTEVYLDDIDNGYLDEDYIIRTADGDVLVTNRMIVGLLK